MAESRGLWPTLPAGAGRSPQLPCATCRKELSDCPVKPAKGESFQAQREQVAEEQRRKRREHWRTSRKAVLLSTLGRRGQGLPCSEESRPAPASASDPKAHRLPTSVNTRNTGRKLQHRKGLTPTQHCSERGEPEATFTAPRKGRFP